METLTITNLGGPLTRRNTGDIKSGLAKFENSWGYDPYSKPGNLTWMEQPTSILSGQGGNGGPIVAMKQRTEGITGATTYVYAINSTGTGDELYKIQAISGSNPNFDSPSLIGTLSDASFGQGASIEFYGSTEKIWVGSNEMVQKINFSGSGATSILGTSSYFSTADPRPLKTFLGKLYFGNGPNIGEIDSTELMVTGTKLSPGLPSGMYVRDLDTTSDGNYLQITATRGQSEQSPLGDVNPGLSLSESYKFYWNGIDAGVTSFEHYPGIRLTTNVVIGSNNNTFGYDQNGLGVLNGQQKILTLPKNQAPLHGATFSTSNMLGFATVEYEESAVRSRGAIYNYGQYDNEVQPGLYRLLRHNGVAQDHVLAVPTVVNVSNLVYSHPFIVTQSSIASVAKMYFSTVEGSVASGSASHQHKLWRFPTVPTGMGSIVAGTYETQTQMFSKKAKIGEVRVYTEPLIGGNDFVVDLIGSGGSVMAGGSQRFQVATGSVATGTDMVQFNPAMAPTYALGVRITNSSVTGVANWTANKIEVDYSEAGR